MRRLIPTLTAMVAVSCAGLTPPRVTIERIPDVVQAFDGNLSQAIDLSLDYLEQAVTKEEQVARAYAAIATMVPATLDRQVKASFRNLSDLIIDAVAQLSSGRPKDWATLRGILQPVVTATNHLTDWLRQLSSVSTAAASGSWQALAQELVVTVTKAAVMKAVR